MSTLLLTLLLSFFQPSPAQDYGRRDTDFGITVEERTEFPPGLNATIETMEVYPCAGYRIRSGLAWKSDTLTLSIGGFVRPSPCVPLPSTAVGETYLGDIADGIYYFRVEYRGETDLYRIVLKDDAAIITTISSTFTRIQWQGDRTGR
jgi:hypothetical protein